MRQALQRRQRVHAEADRSERSTGSRQRLPPAAIESESAASGAGSWDHLAQDLRFTVRSLRRTPGYVLAVIATLGLGIGANTAIFGVVNGVLLHPLPYADAGRLVRINLDRPRRNQTNIGAAIAEVWDYRRNLTTIDDVVEYHQMNFVLLDQGQPDRVATGVVSSSYFETFGITPLFGRTFRRNDDDLGAEPVLVLSNAYWLKHFGGKENVVGTHVVMNDKVHTIVGILPPIPGYPQENDVYMSTSACPFRAQAQATIAQNRRAFPALRVFGRLKAGTTPDQANAEVQAVTAAFVNARPDVYKPDQTGFSANTSLLEGEIVQQARPIVLALLATTGLVLLIACANVANLALSRTLRRERELSLRTALGARRSRLVRQLLTEHLVLALAGGVVGAMLAWTTSGMLGAFARLFTPRAVDASVDGTVLLFTLVISIATGIGFGTVPALASRPTLLSSMKDGAWQSGDSRHSLRMRSVLVMAQVAIGFALVTAAGLFLQSLYNLSKTELGYRHADQVLAAEVYGNFTKQSDGASTKRLYEGVLDRLRAVPGVTAVAATNAVPQSSITPFPQPLLIDGQGAVDAAHLPQVDGNVATEDYFDILGIPLLAGRTFAARDDENGAKVAVINQTMAALWGSRHAVGSTITIGLAPPMPGMATPSYTVIGVVGDVKQYGVDEPALAEFYVPLRQLPDDQHGAVTLQVMLRATANAGSLVAPLRDAVRSVDPDVPVQNVRTLEQLRESRLTTPRLGATLVGVFAILSLVITLAGLGAVIATTVSQRTREFGLRMALGASRGAVLGSVLRQAAWLVAIGLTLGLGGAVLVGRSLQAYLYQTPTMNPAVYAGVAVLFVLAAGVACMGPARRATSIDPLAALRAE